MPVEKEKPWHGLALECPVVLDATSPLYAMRCFSYKLRAHKPLFRGLSVATRGELSNAFRLSQAYAYIVPHFLAEKLAKFQKKKAAIAGRQLFSLILLRHPARRSTRQPLHRGYHFP